MQKKGASLVHDDERKGKGGTKEAVKVDGALLRSVLSTFVESLLMMPKRREAASGGAWLPCTVWSHWLRYPYSPTTTASSGPSSPTVGPAGSRTAGAAIGADNDVENLSRFMQDLIAMPLNLVIDFYHGGQTVRVNPFGSNVHTWLGLDALTVKEVGLLSVIVRHHDVLLGSVNSDHDRRWLRIQGQPSTGHGDGDGRPSLDRERLLMSFCYGFLVESVAHGRYMDAKQTLTLALRNVQDGQRQQSLLLSDDDDAEDGDVPRGDRGATGREGEEERIRGLDERRRIVSVVERHVSRGLLIGDVVQYAQEFLVNSLHAAV
jgi:hypothetical protein